MRSRRSHRVEGEERFLYRASCGSWMVGRSNGIARNAGWIASSTAGALVPLDLLWEVCTGGSWQADAALLALGGGP